MKTACYLVMVPVLSLEWGRQKSLITHKVQKSSHPGNLRLCHRISLGNPAGGKFDAAFFGPGELEEDFMVT